ncbi:fructosamine kinase family protein [Mycolicibacterium sp. F2034L]|uniref:fructosamine kinase family protein n=1 Tax=Mycolicibacterium sp. F2034L TaxID=2926422 RepID=UPI001FF59495|nr:fructosamine kinase family protein [Mycolicibacterium sp. F2034L]MCK0177086.1 fructosamine kinase family protein [Mycolicibacterium sp. F2034L]
MTAFVKRRPDAPPGFFACEAAGLRWLAVPDGVPCVRVLDVDASALTLERLHPVSPTPTEARTFGTRLAVTHAAGAAAFGAAPDGWTGTGFFGPLSNPLPMSLTGHDAWGEFYARERIGPMGERARPQLSNQARADLDTVIARCATGEYDDGSPAARLHGDLWSGNVMWTADGVVLIDPAAHGGHHETDLAMLALFGCPFPDDVIAGYEQVRPLRPGWRQRTALHQLYPLLAHVALFGSGYVGQTERALTAAIRASPGG